MTALILVPIAFGLLAGLGLGVADLMVEGARSVLPTVVTLVFALLYFAVMIEAGLFEPLVRTIMRWAGAHPTAVTIASVLIPGIIALDGSGTTAALVAVAALGPVYDRLGMNKLMLFTLLMMADILAHTVPWGSPTIRAATAMHVDPMGALCADGHPSARLLRLPDRNGRLLRSVRTQAPQPLKASFRLSPPTPRWKA